MSAEIHGSGFLLPSKLPSTGEVPLGGIPDLPDKLAQVNQRNIGTAMLSFLSQLTQEVQQGKDGVAGRSFNNNSFYFGDGSSLVPTETRSSMSLQFPDKNVFAVSVKANNMVTVQNQRNGQILTFNSTDMHVNQNGVLTFQDKPVRTLFGIKFNEEMANVGGSLTPVDISESKSLKLPTLVNGHKIKWDLPMKKQATLSFTIDGKSTGLNGILSRNNSEGNLVVWIRGKSVTSVEDAVMRAWQTLNLPVRQPLQRPPA